jgi:hypothetical protein
MSRFPLIAPFGFCALLSLSIAPAAAECKDLKQFLKDETAGADKYVDMFTFRRDRRGDSVLMFVKDSVERGRLPKRWLFLHREGENATDFCVAGRGARLAIARIVRPRLRSRISGRRAPDFQNARLQPRGFKAPTSSAFGR